MKKLIALLLFSTVAVAQHYRQPSQMSIDGTFTFATLPSASTYNGYTAYTSDQGPVYSNGSVWASMSGGGIPPTIAAYSYLGNATGSSAAPTALTSPFSFGSSLVPVVLNSYTITGTVTANSTTFVCVTQCTKLQVGQGVTGSDGVNLIFPSLGGQLGTLITNVGTGINGATITVNYSTNASLTPGTYTITVGKNRWDLNSTVIVNSIGANHIWAGEAATGNSTWAQQYLSGDCDDGTKATNCFLMNNGATVNNFWGARSSDAAGSPEANISLYVNDNTSVAMGGWNHYWETILLENAGAGKETHGLESTVYNFNSHTQKLDPYNFDVGSTLENLRLTSGQSGVSALGTMYNASDAISILPINSIGFETGILFGHGSLDEVTLAHPPAIALPAGSTGYGITWYRATGYTTPAWNLYATSASQNGNTLSLNDTNATVAIVNPSGTGSVFIESGALAMSGTHEAVFSGTGNNAGLDVANATINDPTSSGAVTLAAISHFGTPTLTSTSATTIATAATVTIDACPVASTGVTITSCQSLRVLAGQTRFSGATVEEGGSTISGATSSINANSNFNTNINTGTSTGTVTIGQNAAVPSAVVIAGPFAYQGGTAYSAASWGTTSPLFNFTAMTMNDTTASGTVTADAAYTIQAPTFTSTGGASTTITNASTLYITGPICSGGLICTNANGLYVTGKTQLTSGVTSSGNTINLNAGSNNVTNINTGSSNGAIHIGDGSGNNAIGIGNGTGVVTGASPWTFSNATVKMTAITTGTNADTVCLKADGTLLIQAAACTISSLRFKEDVLPFKGDALGILNGLEVRTFRMKKDVKLNPDRNAYAEQIGLIAENIAKIEPRCAIYEQDMKTPKSYRQECVIALLVKAIQEQQGEIAELRRERH